MVHVLVGDLHLSDNPPSSRTDDYSDDILTKLEWIVDYANQVNAESITQLGDVFHVKVPHRTSHGLVRRTAEILAAFRGRVLIVPGNHDLQQDRLESIPTQPLGTLALSSNITLLQGLDTETGIYGIPYTDDLEDLQTHMNVACDETLVGTRPALIAVHAAIFPSGINPPYPHLDASQIVTEGVPVAMGHIHDSYGFFRSHDAWVCNNGAISRGSLHEETLKREPKITLFDPDATGCPFTSVDVPHRPAAEVFRLAEVAQKQEREEKLDEFLESVGKVSLTSLSMEQVIAHAESTELSPRAKAELREIIESVL